jgi:hypothetical protein
MTSSLASFLQVATPVAALLISVASLILTGAIAFITLGIQRQQTEIQRQQADTNKNQLRFHLFDKRWTVYKATIDLIDVTISKGTVPGDELWKFAVATRGARFLFNQEVQDYLDKLRKEGVAVQIGQHLIDNPTGRTQEQHRQSVEAWSDRMMWFTQQAAEIERRFAPFLQIAG